MVNKLELYKTAYSPMYENFVEITKIRYDDNGRAIIHARIAHSEQNVAFRQNELIDYCL